MADIDQRALPAAEQTPPEALSDHAVASRLSYFIWSSMPDEELRNLADEGELNKDDILQQQVERMLDDPKARRFINDFSGQWLGTASLENETLPRDPTLFPDFDANLQNSMLQETRSFFWSFINDDRPLEQLVTASDSFVNDELASHYELPLPNSSIPVKQSTEERARAGLLGHASIHTLTSMPARTSIVARGAWVLDRLLCSPPPPPPPAAEGLIEETAAAGNIRQAMEAHRANPACAGCHSSIDPLGFPLEAFDAVGRHRERYPEGSAIDTRGKLGDGRILADVNDLGRYVAENPLFRPCMTQHLASYAVGRKLETLADRCQAASLLPVSGGEPAQGMRQLVHELVQSPLFRQRQVDSEEVQP